MDDKGYVLIVDDDEGILVGLKRVLEREGYRVEGARAAPIALEQMEQQRFDLVVTDLQMPGMDGLELLGEIKRRSPEMPVVMITAHGSTDAVIAALRAGVSDFVTKPFSPRELLNIVGREVSRRRSVTTEAPPVLGLQLSPAQLDEIGVLMAETRAETNARCVLLIEGNGHLVEAKGNIEDINISALASLVAGDFAATAGIASLLGEEETFQINYHEGEQYGVYAAQVMPDLFLLIVFRREIKLGVVMYHARYLVPQLREIAQKGQMVPRTVQEEPSPPPTVQEGEPPAGPQPLLSLDEAIKSGALGEDFLANLDEQFGNLWMNDD